MHLLWGLLQLSKIGEHAYSTTGWTPRCGIVKAFNCGPAPLAAAHPKAALFYRHYIGDWAPFSSGADVAANVVSQLKGFRAPGRLWIELFVGPDQGDWQQGDWTGIDAVGQQVQDAVTFLRTHAPDIGLAAFSWYTGQPEREVWDYIAAHNWYGIDPNRDVISVQEYTNTGTIADPVNVGRFTRLLDAGWKGRVAILEAGVDKCGKPGCGWQTYLTQDQFYAYLRDYDALLQKYPQVIGATVYNAPGWPSFEFHDPNGEFNYTAPQGGTTVAGTIEDRVAALEQRDALLTQALARFRQGKFEGADGLDADIVALMGNPNGDGSLPFTPSYPPKA